MTPETANSLLSTKKTWNFYHLANCFAALYGKPIRFFHFFISKTHLFAELRFEDAGEENEIVMFKIWMKKISDSAVRQVPQYDLILWKENIYTNDYCMPNEEKRKRCFDILRQICSCLADHLAGSYQITLDNKLLSRLFSINHSEIKQQTKSLFPANCPIDADGNMEYWYKKALDELSDHIQTEQYLLHELGQRGSLKKSFVRKALYETKKES